jgi:hypothetical protein
VARKLSNISDFINSSSDSFKTYLKESLDDEIYKILIQISKKTDFQIFSGVIRNFFLKEKGIRDLDIVLNDEIDLESIFFKKNIFKNSFGGYKIKTKKLDIDLWYVKNTWAYNYQKTMDFDLASYLPATAFFNFSSISYSFNKQVFFYTKDFLRFLRDKEINVVHKPNSNLALCVVNSFYYSEKYKLKISKKLFEYLIYLDSKQKTNSSYSDVQIKHFNQILFLDDEIKTFLRKDKNEMPIMYIKKSEVND